MSIIDRILALLTPYECLGCAAEGSLLCMACTQQLTTVPERCYRCHTPSINALTCSRCSVGSNLHQVQVGAAYSGIAKDLVWKLKFSGAQAAVRQMVAQLLPLLDAGHTAALVPVPTATNRVRRRGYDQAKLLARELSRRTALPYLDCLSRTGQTHQVGASRKQRLGQLNGAFRANSPARIRGTHILLIDDVLTTGATLETAAKLLKMHGAAFVAAMVFAQAEGNNLAANPGSY